MYKKLSDKEVLEIFNSTGVQKDTAKKYGVTKGLVSNIKTGLRHGHITGKNYVKITLDRDEVYFCQKCNRSFQYPLSDSYKIDYFKLPTIGRERRDCPECNDL